MRGDIVDRQHSMFDMFGQHLLVQRTFFTAPFPEISDDLYASAKGVVERHRERIVVHPHARLCTNTFFGRFPASYWQRWTEVAQIEFRIVAQGTGRISIRASDSVGDARTVATAVIEDAQREQVRLVVQVDRFVDGGAMWLEACAGGTALVLEAACWWVAKRERARPTGLVICTYNRADDCLRTLETLSGDGTALAMVDAVYVIDQGNDTVESRAGFAAVALVLGSKLRYLRQPNLGGAGGFTRGLYEVTEGCGSDNNDHAHILFMDDDIMLEPDTVVRLTTFANCTTAPTIVGGQMLYLLHPNQLHVGAEATDLTILRAGLPVKDALVQADLTKKRQDVRVDAEYNAWWACLIPSEVVAATGYPLPLFFQWDDIEYGLRARAHGYSTVTLPGAGVWHADFHWKDWDDWPRYFSLRNSLIVNALYGHPKRTGTARYLMGQLLFYIVSMRYGLAATLIMAVEDFLAGPDILRDGGVEAAAAVRKLRAEYPETTRHPAHGIPGIASTAIPVTAASPMPSRPNLVLIKRLIWQLLGKPQASAAINARDSHWWHVSRFGTAVVTEPSQEGVRVRRLDRVTMRKLLRRGVRVLTRLAREEARVRRQYQAAMPELTGRQNWRRLFDTR
jgi:galactofuranosylgalactofuranosylrhamnosyl-N-acetylglucosaminyl-diphospho-decaprenol beta-1,5/1,6-galactofuranosyltransferase